MLLIALSATLVAATSAYAAEMQGVVAEIDHAARTVVLEDGASLMIAESADHGSIMVGDMVSLVTDDATGEVTEIMAGK
jgi:DNA-binding MurR/RpiR family transcriptional regulator